MTQAVSNRRILVMGACTALAAAVVLPASAADVPSQLGEGRALVTFSGLRVYQDGSSTLRVNLTKNTPIEYDQSGTRLVFMIKGARVHLKNNKNPLRAEHFKSNVVRSKLDDTKEGVKLEVTLRKAAAPEHRVIRHAGGAILRIDIPPPR